MKGGLQLSRWNELLPFAARAPASLLFSLAWQPCQLMCQFMAQVHERRRGSTLQLTCILDSAWA